MGMGSEKMKFKYFFGLIISNLYRLLRVFPNSDPIMGFVLPAAKNEAFWKAPLFAFAAMFSFDIITGHFGVWTWVTSFTYALAGLGAHFFLKNKKSSLRLFLNAGVWGVLFFDLVTGPIMSTFLFSQPFWLTFLMQIPFTLMHLISVSFSILIISPFLDRQLNEEITGMIVTTKTLAKNSRWFV